LKARDVLRRDQLDLVTVEVREVLLQYLLAPWPRAVRIWVIGGPHQVLVASAGAIPATARHPLRHQRLLGALFLQLVLLHFLRLRFEHLRGVGRLRLRDLFLELLRKVGLNELVRNRDV
jgi:hypothetical protein